MFSTNCLEIDFLELLFLVQAFVFGTRCFTITKVFVKIFKHVA